MALPEVTARLDADVSGFIAAWDRAADAAERAAARIRAAQQGLGDIDVDTSSFGDLNRELERMTRTLRQTTDQLREFGNSARESGGGLDELGDRARRAGEALGGSGGGGLGGGMLKAGTQAKLMAAGIAVIASVLPAVAAAALAAGAALQGMAVVGAVVVAGWKGIEQAGERLKASLSGLQKQLESVFRSELSGEFQKLGQAISTLDGPLKAIAHSVSDVIKEFTGWIRSAEGMRQIETMLGGVDNMVKSLAPGAKALAQSFTSFGEAAAPAMDEIGAALSSVFENLNKVIQKHKDTGQLTKAFEAGAAAIEAFGEVLAGIVDILIEMAASGGKPAAEAIKKFGVAMQDAAPMIGTLFHMLAGSINQIMTVVGWLAKLAKAMEPITDAADNAMTAVDGFLKVLDPAKAQEFGTSVGGAFEIVKKVVKDGVDKAIESVKNWWEQTKKEVENGVERAKKAVKDWIEKTVEDVKKGVDKFIEDVKKWWEKTKAEVENGVEKAKKFVKDWIDKQVEEIKKGVDDWLKEVRTWWDDTVSEIQGGIDSAIAEIEKLPDKAMSALDSWVEDMKRLGQDAINGIAEGIESAVSNLVSAATQAAQAAMDAIKQTLGIASPSIRFKQEVGEMIPAGIAEGIIGNAGVVTDAMHRLGISSLGAGQGSAATGRSSGQNLTIQVTGGADSAAGTFIARLAQQGKLKITANAIVGGR